MEEIKHMKYTSEEWVRFVESLPKKRMSAAGLILDAEGRLLLVKPSYNDVWHLPGGVVEAMESPKDAASRELREETGLALQAIRMLCVDYKKGKYTDDDTLIFIFDFGELAEEAKRDIRIDNVEIIDRAFVSVEESREMLTKEMGDRVNVALSAMRQETSFYAEEQRILDPDS